MSNRTFKRRISSILLIILFGLALLGPPPSPAKAQNAESPPTFGNIRLWPDGRVPYRFDTGSNDGEKYTDPFSIADKAHVRDQMNIWQDALKIADPSNGSEKYYIWFWECGSYCPKTGYVLVRYNKKSVGDNAPTETNNMCTYFEGGEEKVGMNPNGSTEFHLVQKDDGDPSDGDIHDGNTRENDNTILHELGHCLGLWHEHQRADRDRWLDEGTFDWDFEPDGTPNPTAPTDNLPLLGNYDYDSVMHYASYVGGGSTGTRRYLDRLGNAFSRLQLDNITSPADRISPRLKSRLLQYYARAYQSKWGFFESLDIPSPAQNLDSLPNPYLDLAPDPDVQAVGTPAIAFQSLGNFDVFARGSNNHLYWRAIRGINHHNWISLGCCFSSDPSAVSRGEERIDVVAVSDRGEAMRLKYIDGVWFPPLSIRGGPPAGGIKQRPGGGYLGPAIASRGANSLDVFVVRSDGRLAISTWENGNWAAWRTLGAGYDVTARPAAVALSATEVQLAINERDVNLYEPRVTFPPLVPSFSLGIVKARTAYQAPPALTKRDSQSDPYRVLIVNADGRISHRFSGGSWRDIGGIPKPGTGPSAVATGPYSAKIVMNGEDAIACDMTCLPGAASPHPGGYIQPGGLWLRTFE